MDGADEYLNMGSGLDRLLRPRSIAIVGLSTKPGSIGLGVLHNLKTFNFGGEIYAVSTSRHSLDGVTVGSSIGELPKGIDVAALCIPVAGMVEAVRECARSNVGAVLCFGAGYAEVGDEGRAIQEEIRSLASEAGMVLLGPNCMGLINFVHGIPLTFVPVINRTPAGTLSGLAILTQSGAMMSNLRAMSQARGIDIGYAISTGNEAMVGMEDFLDYLLEDTHTKVIAVYVEQIRQPQRFLQLAIRAKNKRKAIVLLQSGRTATSKEAVQSHTGSLAGDYATVKALLGFEAVVVVETMEELFDVAWLLTWFESPPSDGVAMLTESGAMRAFALDFVDPLGLQFPLLSASTSELLREVLPPYTKPSNPLDMTAQALSDMSLYTKCAELLLADSAIGSLLLTVMPGSPELSLKKTGALLPALDRSGKPVVYVMLSEGQPVSGEVESELRTRRIPLFRSPERALRALAHCASYTKHLSYKKDDCAGQGVVAVPSKNGFLTEAEGKRLLSKLGIAVPDGQVCVHVDEAIEVARSIGWPVVMKAQAPELIHKSDAQGVFVNIHDETELRFAWSALANNLATVRPDVSLEGVLIERMCKPGVEMVVGARRDDDWGPVVMVGMGGIWTELFQDVRLLPPGLHETVIVEQILSLRSAALLQGARGTPIADIKALARVVSLVGTCLAENTTIREIEINPVTVYPEGAGVVALDALIHMAAG